MEESNQQQHQEQAQEVLNHEAIINKRINAYKAALEPMEGTTRIDMKLIRKLAFDGIPDNAGLRSTYWKLLLDYLPPDKSLWEETLAAKRKSYREFKEFFITNPSSAEDDSCDHPLSTSTDSKWNKWFQDKDRLELIERDVHRTLPDLHFFNDDGSGQTKHGKALIDILFVYSKTNTATNYVQGMNEVLAPIYYVLSTDPAGDSLENIEADSFFCFSNLMGEISDCFAQKMDNYMLDTHNTIGRFQALLATLDGDLFVSFYKKSLDPRFYALRWLSLLFSQEFNLPDVLRLWDSLFGDEKREDGNGDFLLFFACALVINIRSDIIDADFGIVLHTLQNYPMEDILKIIMMAKELRKSTPVSALDPSAMESVVHGLIGDLSAVDVALKKDELALKKAAEDVRRKSHKHKFQ